MRFSSSAVAIASILSFIPNNVLSFTTGTFIKSRSVSSVRSHLFATVEDEKTKSEDEQDSANAEINPDAEGLPWWWDMVWKLDVMQKGEPGTDCTFGDSANVLRTNIEQIYGGYPSLDGCPLAEGDIADIADGTQFIGLQKYFNEYGSPYKLCFGPKSFLVISDPVQAKHILKDFNSQYDKGLLAGMCCKFSFWKILNHYSPLSVSMYEILE